MTRWVLGPITGALAVAPLGFGDLIPVGVAGPAKVMFGILLAAGLIFAALAALWGRRWKLTVQ